MSRRKKIKVIVPIVIMLFFGAYGRHRYRILVQQPNIVGRLQARDMDEISGIAASGINDSLYYVHNDSGDTSRFFAIRPTGELKSTIYFKGNVRGPLGVRDCEDIAVGPGPVKGKSYVYIGDIGDNDSQWGRIAIYRIPEKKTWANESLSRGEAESVILQYPDGPRDAETLMIDPIEKLIYIITKREDSVTVYTTPLIFKSREFRVLTKRCKLFFPGVKLFKWITGGDISRDGQQVLIKSYTKVFYWKRDGNEPIWKTIQKKPRILPYIQEKQGEAIGFTPDGKGYYTVSEGVYSPIYYYKTPEK